MSTISSKESEEEANQPSIWDCPIDDLKIIFENNRKWRHEQLAKDPQYFEKLAIGQKPKYLLIGCSDSRVG